VGTHEDLGREHEVESSSDRSFGLVMAAFFGFIGVFRALWTLDPSAISQPISDHLPVPRYVLLAVAGVFLLFALVAPKVLAPLNKLWTKLGLLLGKIMAPIVLGLLLFLVVTPIGVLMRLLGKDPLRLRLDAKSKSYWIVRTPPGPAPDTMSNQF
jgi:hypothetical protein